MPIPMPLAKYFAIHDTEPLITLTSAIAGRLINAVGGEVPRPATSNDNVVSAGVSRIRLRRQIRRRVVRRVSRFRQWRVPRRGQVLDELLTLLGHARLDRDRPER